MMNGRKLGVIDNQDAILGNRFYDLASLIDDVRIKIPHRIQENLFKYYVLKSRLNLRNLKLLNKSFQSCHSKKFKNTWNFCKIIYQR